MCIPRASCAADGIGRARRAAIMGELLASPLDFLLTPT